MLKIANMERAFTPQLSGLMMVMAWQPKCASHHPQGKAIFYDVHPGSSGVVACSGWKDRQQHRSGLSFSNYSSRIQELQGPLNLVPCHSDNGKFVRRANKRRVWASSVLNEVMGQRSGSQVPPGRAAALPDDLKDQLESLQNESLQVRNRYNNAKARFMRLTEVAQQLRQRATIDLNIGNEDGARKALLEKQKVIQAAELSKKRAQLLEELSIKLGEAISVKETQLIVALSSPQSGAPTVRVVSPKGEPARSADLNLNREENPAGLGTVEASQCGAEVIDSQNFATSTEFTKGDSRQVGPESGDVLIEREQASLATELGYSTDRYLDGNEGDVEATTPKSDSNNMNLPLGGEESDKESRDGYLKFGGSVLLKDSLEGASFAWDLSGVTEMSVSDIGITSSCVSDIDGIDSLRSDSAGNGEVCEPSIDVCPEGGDSHNGSEKVGISCEDTSLDEGEATRGASHHEGRSHLVKHLMLDVDPQVAAIESKLRTAVSKSMDANDIELRLVGDLLEQVQNLRARISEVVGSLTRQGME